MRAALAAVAALGCALAVSACSLSGSSAAPSPVTTSTVVTTTGPSPAAIARTRHTHELPTPAPRPHVAGGWRTPTGAVTAFATTYINWTASTIAAGLRGLSQASVGQARAVTARAAAEVARDRELHEGGVANAGIVESIAPEAGHPGAYVVVTRERTTAARDGAYRGLAPAWHVSLATVTRLPGGLWVLSGWQPQN